MAKSARARSVLFLLAGALLSLASLVCVSGILVRTHEQSRAADLEPVLGDSGQSGMGYTSLIQTYRGHAVLLVRLAARPTMEVIPPGLTQIPGPGTVVVSPRLSALMQHDPALQAWFPSPPADVLPRSGVGSAGDLRAYVGVTPDQLGAVDQHDVVGFGTDRIRERGFGWYEASGFALFLILPAVGVLITTSRFGRRERHQRNLALRLAGMSTSAANAVGAIEMALPVGIGAVVAAVAYRFMLPDYLTLPIVDRAIFGVDALPGVSISLGVVALAVVTAAVLGAGSASRASTPVRLGSVLSPHRLVRPRSIVVFAAGVGAVVVSWVRKEPRDPALWLAILLLGVGLPGATAFTARRVAKAVARPQTQLSRLIAMRRIAADPQATTRIAGTVAIAVFVVAAAQPITQVIATPSLDWITTARMRGSETVLSRAETLEAVPLPWMVPPPSGVTVAVPAIGLWAPESRENRPEVTALIATCDELRELVQADLPSCRPEPLAIRPASSTESERRIPAELVLRSADRRTEVASPEITASIEIPEEDLPIDASIVLPPDEPAMAQLAQPYVAAVYARVQADEVAWEAARAWIISASPAYRLENALEASATGDTTGSWVLLGLIVTSGITALAAVLIAGDESQRRREWFALRAMGMSRLQLVRIQAIESAATGLVAMILAVSAGIAVGSAFLQVGNDSLSTNAAYIAAGVGGLVAVVVAAVVTSAAVHSRSAL